MIFSHQQPLRQKVWKSSLMFLVIVLNISDCSSHLQLSGGGDKFSVTAVKWITLCPTHSAFSSTVSFYWILDILLKMLIWNGEEPSLHEGNGRSLNPPAQLQLFARKINFLNIINIWTFFAYLFVLEVKAMNLLVLLTTGKLLLEV